MLRRWYPFVLLLLVVLAGPVLYAQTAQAVTGVPVQAPQATEEWGGALIWAFLSSSALEWLKRNAMIGVITERTTFFAQRAIGIVLSLAAALGVHTAFDPTAGALTITGLVVPSMWVIGKESMRQWVLQEITYRTSVKNFGRSLNSGQILR